MSARSRRRFLLTASLAIMAVLWAREDGPGSNQGSPEVARIQAHIFRAERLAAARDVSGLSPAARAARRRLLQELAVYRRRGVFPQNRDFPGRRMPYFIDARGVRCAMAHLIELSGGATLVQRIARTRNNAYVRELADEPELIAWLDRNGLSVEEAARIQPSYGGEPEVYPAVSREERNAMIVAALGASSAGILLNAWNGSTHTTAGLRGFPGIGLGLGATIMGGVVFADPRENSKAWGTLCMSLGVTSMVMGFHQLAHAPPPRMSPVVLLGLDGTPGLALRMEF